MLSPILEKMMDGTACNHIPEDETNYATPVAESPEESLIAALTEVLRVTSELSAVRAVVHPWMQRHGHYPSLSRFVDTALVVSYLDRDTRLPVQIMVKQP